MLPIGSRVEIYWNLHKGCYSVRHKGRVVKHTSKIALKDVSFAVQQAGRRKVLEEKVKNVHAFVRGTYAGENFDDFYDCSTLATYNPYKYNSFVEKDNETPLYEAGKAFLTSTMAGMPRMLIKKEN